MTHVSIAKATTPTRSAAAPGTWWRSRATLGPSEAVAIKCPQCHRASTLRHRDGEGTEVGHAIADDGMVQPSVVCPHVPCTWHVFVKLEGWTP